jgi:tetratricopeptide (TPR) repeat protein
VVHFAEYSELPGKKIWTWGVDAAGLEWRTALSDNNSAYSEVQAGLFRNQETYSFLEPGETIRFSEFWMPVRGTGGISRANKAGVVHFDAHGSQVSASLNVNERIQGAQLSLTQNGTVLWSGTADLTPAMTWSHSVAANGDGGKVIFELKDHAGRSLLKQTDGEYDWDPVATINAGPPAALRIPEPAKRSEDDWLQVGRDQELNGEVVLAHATYETALEKFPRSQSLLIAEGRLAASLERYEEAERLLQLAQERDTPNSEIAYYLGISEEGLGRTRAAETSFEIAYRQAELRGPAAIRLGELRAQQGDLEGAVTYLRAAVAAEPDNVRGREQLEAVLRAKGENSEADRLTNLGLTADPMSDFLKEDSGKPDLEHLAADPYRVLRVANDYMQLGLYRKALEVLDREYPSVPADQSEPGTMPPQKHPMVRYYAAYCKEKLGTGAERDWQEAAELSPSLVFPSSETDRTVLEAALKANRNDATAHYLLGTLLFSKGVSDAGMAEWTEAKQLAPHLPVLDVEMGDVFLKLKGDPRRALTSFRESLKNDAENAEGYVGLDEAMSLTGASAEERADLLSQYPSADAADTKMPAELVYQLALARAEAGQYERALAPFKDRFFPSEEGGITSGQVVFEIKLMQAEAWAKAGNCAQAEDFLAGKQPGMGLDGRTARDYVKLAGMARSCAHEKTSDEFLHKAAASGDGADLVWAIRAKESLGLLDSEKANEQIAHSLAAAENQQASGSQPAARWYGLGLLQAALNQKEQARKSFEQALVLPDARMTHHLAREALAELAAER